MSFVVFLLTLAVALEAAGSCSFARATANMRISTFERLHPQLHTRICTKETR